MAAEAGAKIDPMHQFKIDPVFGGHLDGSAFTFTNSALWMLIVLACVWVFMMGGLKRQLVPGRWQVAVEFITSFISDTVKTNIGPEGRKYTPWVFTVFIFILFANLLGMMPVALIPGAHAFTVTSHFSITGVLAIISFSIVLIVGFWKHGLHFFSLFVPQGAPLAIQIFMVPIELFSFLVRPFSLALRLFVAMFAGHVLIKVFGYFIVQGITSGSALGYGISAVSFVFITGVSALELLVCCIQAYVFAILTSLYIKDAVHLH